MRKTKVPVGWGLWLWIGALAGLALLACAACAPGAPGRATTPLAPTSAPALIPSPASGQAPPALPAMPAKPALATSEPVTCTFSNVKPTPGPTEVSLFPGVRQSDWKQGPDSARVVFIEYGDFQ